MQIGQRLILHELHGHLYRHEVTRQVRPFLQLWESLQTPVHGRVESPFVPGLAKHRDVCFGSGLQEGGGGQTAHRVRREHFQRLLLYEYGTLSLRLTSETSTCVYT